MSDMNFSHLDAYFNISVEGPNLESVNFEQIFK